MYQEQQTMEMGKARLVSEFYYSLALLQRQATDYVANGKNDEDKLGRIQKIIELMKRTGGEIPDEPGDGNVPNHTFEHCDPPCRGDKLTMMCICDEGGVGVSPE